MWLDDILSCINSLEEARQINTKIDHIMKQRGLSLNKTKSVCIVLGSKKQRSKASEDMKINPLLCGSFETKEKEEYKWLGQILSSAGLADSVTKTIAEKEGKIRGACLEIVLIVND